jgi:hypothetical protein
MWWYFREKHGHRHGSDDDLKAMDVSTKMPSTGTGINAPRPAAGKGAGVVSFALRDYENEAPHLRPGGAIPGDSENMTLLSVKGTVGASFKPTAPEGGNGGGRGPGKDKSRESRKKVTNDFKS